MQDNAESRQVPPLDIVERESGDERAFSWDREQAYRGSDFLGEADVNRLIRSGERILVLDVSPLEDSQYGKRRVVDLELPDGTAAKKSFTVVNKDGTEIFAGRALMLQDFADHLEAGGAPIPVKFVQAGNAYTLGAVEGE